MQRVALGLLSASLFLAAAAMACRNPAPASLSAPPSAGPPTSSLAPPQARASVTMDEFDDDFGPIFPRPEWVIARGFNVVTATSYTTEKGKPVGGPNVKRRRYGEGGALEEDVETSDGKPVWTTRIARVDPTTRRETLTNAFTNRTSITTIKLDASGLIQTRHEQSDGHDESEKYFYEGRRLVRVERRVNDQSFVKRIDWTNGAISKITIEREGKTISEEVRERDASQREMRRTRKSFEGGLVPSAPVVIDVHYTPLGNIETLDVVEGGKPLLRRTLRYRDDQLVEERRESPAPAVGDMLTTFTYDTR